MKASGTHPSMSEQLISFVSHHSSISILSLIRNVGQGSNRTVLIILSTSSSEACRKTVIFGGSEGGCTSFSVPEGISFLNFVGKNEANCHNFQTRGMEVSHQRPCSGFYPAHTLVFYRVMTIV